MKRGASALHILLDFAGCDPGLLADPNRLREILYATAKENGLTVLNEVFHRFQPHGVSGVLLISESHISLHTWPERGYAAVDVFSCKPEISVPRLQATLERELGSKRTEVQVIHRGEAVGEEEKPAR